MNKSKQYLQTEQLLGNWHAKRLVLDKLNSFNASYEGEMNISFHKNINNKDKRYRSQNAICLHLLEKGKLNRNNKEYLFSQSYTLQLSQKKCKIFLNNNILVFSIKRLIKTQNINHVCNLDRYDGGIKFVAENSFLIYLNVSGPNKKYYLKVVYKRI